MSPWDYVAIVAVWYVMAARPAVGADFHLGFTTRLLWPLFWLSLVPHGFHHAAFRAQVGRTTFVLSMLVVVAYGGFRIAALISDNIAIRFVLTFPIAGVGSAIVILGTGLVAASLVPPKAQDSAVRHATKTPPAKASGARAAKGVRPEHRQDSGTASNTEVQFYEAVEDYIRSMGWYDRLLELQGTDGEFCTATFKVYKAGYEAGQSPKVVGALAMDGANRYPGNRRLAILFLQGVEQQFASDRPAAHQ
jgi:hypothetical protein